MFTAIQVLLIVLWFTAYTVYGRLFGALVAGGCVLQAYVVGLIMGDVPTALLIGGTYELMNIGLNPLGGSTVPDYAIGSIVGAAFGALYGIEMGMSVGIVVATLSTTLDVFAKTVGSFFLHEAKKSFAAHDFKKGYNWIHLGFWPGVLVKTTIPALIILVAGQSLVGAINSSIPVWLLNGFKNAGNILPCLGFAILLRSLQIQGNLQYLLIGFFLYAYLGVNALGTAVVGLALAMMAFYQTTRLNRIETALGGDDDE